jgi:hypothetical protein
MRYAHLHLAASLMAQECQSDDSTALLVWYAGGTPAQLARYNTEFGRLSAQQQRDLIHLANVKVSRGLELWLDSVAMLANGFAYTSKVQSAAIAAKKAELAAG